MNSKKSSLFGFINTDSLLPSKGKLAAAKLEYLTKSAVELKELLQQKIELEEYEECALIRDELIKRNSAN